MIGESRVLIQPNTTYTVQVWWYDISRDVGPHTLILRLVLIGHPEFLLIFTLPHKENVCLELIAPRAIVFSFFVYLD